MSAVSSTLSHDAVLQKTYAALGVSNPIVDESALNLSVFFIWRALLCMPFKSAHTNVHVSTFTIRCIRLYNNIIYCNVVYAIMLYLLIFPFCNGVSSVAPPLDRDLVKYCDVVAVFLLSLDSILKCLAFKSIAYKIRSPRDLLDREVFCTYVIFLSLLVILLQALFVSPSIEIGTFPLGSTPSPRAVFARSPLFRPLLIIARSRTMQHYIMSKINSLRHLTIAMLTISLVTMTIVTGLTQVVGITLKAPYNSMALTNDYGHKGSDSAASVTADNLPDLWHLEQDGTVKGGLGSDFSTVLHSSMTLFIALGFGNLYPIFDEFRVVHLSNKMKYTPYENWELLLPQCLALCLVAFFVIFVLVADCVVVSICINGFAQYRSTKAQATYDSERENLKFAYRQICAAGGNSSISKGVWLALLSRVGHNSGAYKTASDFHTSGSLPSLVPARHFAAGAPRMVLVTLAVHLGGEP